MIIQEKKRYLSYESNPRLLAVSFALTALAFVLYMLYFDILVPSIPHGGSVRYSSGPYFVLPVFLLVGGQILFNTYLLHVSIKAGEEGRQDLIKAFFVSSVQVFLFSLFYAFHPFYGPYTFIVYFTPGQGGQNFPSYSIPLFSLWVMVIIGVTTFLIRKVFDLKDHPSIGTKRILILSATMLGVILSMAS